MIVKNIILEEVCENLKGSSATLTAYARDLSPEMDESARYPAIVICPGGAYRMTSDREAEPVALAFLAEGYQVFVLRYSVAPAKYPTALTELFSAIAYLRKNAEYYHLDEHKLITAGFSAGGHLAASSGILFNDEDLLSSLPYSAEEVRPDAMILSYPVITSKAEYANCESFEMLLGEHPDETLMHKLSLENSVHPGTVPAFIWHTVDDNCVPSENSLLLAGALKKNQVPFELHLYPNGAHGLSLATELCACPLYPQHKNAHVAQWFPTALRWLSTLF